MSSRYTERFRTLAVVLVGSGVATLAARASDCTGMQVASAAIGQWQASRLIELSPAAQKKLVDDFCEAVASVGRRHQVGTDRLEAAASGAIPDYLDRVIRTDIGPRTMESTLDDKLGFAGLARPVPNTYGRLTVQYVHQVEYLSFDGVRHAPFAEFLVVAGITSIEGYAAGQSVCSVRVSVPPAGAATVSC
jgi:hypothetical protein